MPYSAQEFDQHFESLKNVMQESTLYEGGGSMVSNQEGSMTIRIDGRGAQERKYILCTFTENQAAGTKELFVDADLPAENELIQLAIHRERNDRIWTTGNQPINENPDRIKEIMQMFGRAVNGFLQGPPAHQPFAARASTTRSGRER